MRFFFVMWAAGLLLGCRGAPPAGADLTVVEAGVIHTLAGPDADRAVTALAFDAGGRIVATGSASDLREAYPAAQRIEFPGATIVPGLIDSHAHLVGQGLALLNARLDGTASIGEVIARLQAHVAALPPEAWLLGRGWDQNDWPEKAFPRAADLDGAFPDRPLWLTRTDGHAGWANGAALALAEERLAANGESLHGDWQPAGGRIHRDEHGVPTGIFVDGAMELIAAVIPEPDQALLERALDRVLAETARLGLTGVHEAGTPWNVLQLYRRRLAEDRLPLRVYAMADGDSETFRLLCDSGPWVDDAQRLVARAVKLYADGALGSRGAALLEPYSDEPQSRGLLFHDDVELAALVERAMRCGLQVNTHAIGDAANRQVLDAYAAAMRAVPDHPGRHRIEHAQVVALEDIPRFAELDIIASMQPTHAPSDLPWAGERLGAERLLGAYAWQRFRQAGVRLALGSDFPVEPMNPMRGIEAAVTRQDENGEPAGGFSPDQRLDRLDALRGFTADAAYAAFQEHDLGTLEAGKFADFVVLERDPLTVPALEISAIAVRATYLAGQEIYRRAERR